MAAKENTKRKIVRSTKPQIRMLVDYMATSLQFANGEFTSPLGTQQYEAEWAKVQALLAEAGPAKSIQQWKHTWRDLRKNARDQAAKARVARGKTGNDAVVQEPSEISLKVLGDYWKRVCCGALGGGRNWCWGVRYRGFFCCRRNPQRRAFTGPQWLMDSGGNNMPQRLRDPGGSSGTHAGGRRTCTTLCPCQAHSHPGATAGPPTTGARTGHSSQAFAGLSCWPKAADRTAEGASCRAKNENHLIKKAVETRSANSV